MMMMKAAQFLRYPFDSFGDEFFDAFGACPRKGSHDAGHADGERRHGVARQVIVAHQTHYGDHQDDEYGYPVLVMAIFAKFII